MTTKPKARKFRIRRNESAAATEGARPTPSMASSPNVGDVPPEELLMSPEAPTDGFGDMALPGSAAAERKSAQAAQSAAKPARPAQPKSAAAPTDGPAVDRILAAIRAEGLTGRQLRMARRLAQKQGLTPNSDFDAVRQLRDRGIDPFAQSNMLELVVNEASKSPGSTGNTLPATRPDAEQMPAMPIPQPRPGPQSAEDRAVEIMQVQRDIARRRRKRLVLLASRLMLFVILPTILVGYYYFKVATPLYATSTEFLIQKAEGGASAGGGLGGLLGGTSFATQQESISVQSYLESREALMRLDEDLGFREHFSNPDFDPLLRLPEDATNEAVFATYRNNLTIGYDPTEGLVKLEILAADPQLSQAFAEALMTYAEERVDQMSQRIREDGMDGARESYLEAEERMLEAQQRVLELQEQSGVLSAEAEVSTVFQQISTFQLELQQERLRLAEMMSATRPNETRVDIAENNIRRLEELIAQLRGGLTDTGTDGASMARIQSELVIARADLETRQVMLSQALQQQESARIEVNRQSLYLSTSVAPLAPDEATYPRAFENTLLAFLIFSGIYLMISMTVAILKEQISS